MYIEETKCTFLTPQVHCDSLQVLIDRCVDMVDEEGNVCDCKSLPTLEREKYLDAEFSVVEDGR